MENSILIKIDNFKQLEQKLLNFNRLKSDLGAEKDELRAVLLGIEDDMGEVRMYLFLEKFPISFIKFWLKFCDLLIS